MRTLSRVGVLSAAASTALAVFGLGGASMAQSPATQPAAGEYAIPHIPVERIVFKGQGYPIIPKDVEALIEQRDDVWYRQSQDAFKKAMPDVEAWAAKGYPWVKVARKPADLIQGDVPAFPGAEGGGMYSRGGRGGRVFVVTSLADSGPGTFREACEAGGPRTIVFGVAGLIKLERPLDIYAPYLTIAGQTAPGDGVCISGHSVHVRTHDVVLRHTRFRRGIADISNRDDTLSGDAIGNIIIDHCSTSWGNDETLSIYRQMYAADPANPKKREKLQVMNNTIQWTIITETLDTFHHGFGATWGGMNTGFHHNLFACNTGRNASISAYDFNFANNVLFNWRHRTLDGGARQINVINNYFKPGPMTEGELRYRIGKSEGGAWHMSGNFVEGNEAVTQDNWNGGMQGERAAVARQRRNEKPTTMPHMTITSAEQAYADVVAKVGATLPKRDAVDERVLKQVRTGEVVYKEGRGIITDISQVGGFPEYNGTPVSFRHNDGIPDAWKTKHNLDLNDAGLHAKDADGDGYTNLEEYLNGTDPTQSVNYKDLKNNVDTLSK